jgi:hypothetical protein
MPLFVRGKGRLEIEAKKLKGKKKVEMEYK